MCDQDASEGVHFVIPKIHALYIIYRIILVNLFAPLEDAEDEFKIFKIEMNFFIRKNKCQSIFFLNLEKLLNMIKFCFIRYLLDSVM